MSDSEQTSSCSSSGEEWPYEEPAQALSRNASDQHFKKLGKSVSESDREDVTSSREGLSKRERRRAEIQNVGANGRARGQAFKESSGFVEYWQPSIIEGEDGRWIDAVYHNDIREELLARAGNNGQNNYDFPRERGLGPHDETAFLESQRHWRGDEKQYLSTITDDIMNKFERRDYPKLTNEVGIMYFKDRIVLDQDNHPLKDYAHIPATLSSQTEGWLMEAIKRLDSRIASADFRARMPWSFINKQRKPQKLYGLSGIGNRIMRCGREPYGIVPWVEKAGSSSWKNYIMSQMTEEDIANNTTANLRTFTKREIDAAKKPNKGQFPSKAGKSRHIAKEKSSTNSARHRMSKSGKVPQARSPGSKTTLDYPESHLNSIPFSNDEVSASRIQVTEEEIIDYRQMSPASEEDAAHIQAALGVTHQFFGQYFHETVPTTPTLSYSEQWYELQMAYTNNMPDEATRLAYNIIYMPPHIPRLSAWYGSFASWRTAYIMNPFRLADGEDLDGAVEPRED